MVDRSPHMTPVEAWDEIQVFLTGPVLAAGVVPGMLLCAPGIIFFGAAVVIPLVVIAILGLAVVAVLGLVAAPFFLMRALVSHLRERRTSAVEPPRPHLAESAR